MTTVDLSWKLRAQKAETAERRYSWLRNHLEYINFEGGHVVGQGHSGSLTSDTSDVGLDDAIDYRIRKEALDADRKE